MTEEDAVKLEEWAFECERIQPKGASFGVLEVSPTYVYFKSANKKKPVDDKYFGSALVRGM